MNNRRLIPLSHTVGSHTAFDLCVFSGYNQESCGCVQIHLSLFLFDTTALQNDIIRAKTKKKKKAYANKLLLNLEKLSIRLSHRGNGYDHHLHINYVSDYGMTHFWQMNNFPILGNIL